jgi:hypothetical protein
MVFSSHMPAAKKLLDTGDVGTWARLLRRNVNHHGKGVRATAAKIVGYVLLYHDKGTLHVSAGAKYSNFGTAEFSGRPLAFSYSHTGSIVVREGSLRGNTIATFNDRTPDMEILRLFTSLIGGR